MESPQQKYLRAVEQLLSLDILHLERTMRLLIEGAPGIPAEDIVKVGGVFGTAQLLKEAITDMRLQMEIRNMEVGGV